VFAGNAFAITVRHLIHHNPMPPVQAGTPTPQPPLPNTAVGVGIGGEPVTVPVELVAMVFLGSLGALAYANVRSRRGAVRTANRVGPVG
jgi:hypothetical protein